jgi:hypothetical protein
MLAIQRAVIWIVVAVGLPLAAAPGARAAQPCNPQMANAAAHGQLLPYAERAAPDFFVDTYGGIETLHYGRRTLLCRDLTGDGQREMVVRMICCTGGSPTPWGIFMRDDAGTWRLRYARALDTVFRLRVRNRSVRAMMPAPYEGACTRYVRFRVVRWSGARFRSQLTSRHKLLTTC